MTTKTLTLLAALIAFARPTAAAAQDGHTHDVIPHYAASAPFGSGKVRTFTTLAKGEGHGRKARRPEQVGVEIPVAVMNGLPATPLSVAIDFPLKASGTPFQFMMLDWNPNGHAPSGVYDKPHFDFHFYLQDYEDVMDITPGPCSGLDCEDFQRATTPVPSKYLPTGYIDVGSVVPYMGNHLVDVTAPEFNGQPFTRTWILGAYDGGITFYEPMMTRQSIVDEPNWCSAITLPQAYAESGYYPTKVCTQLDTRRSVYRLFLTGFVYRQQS